MRKRCHRFFYIAITFLLSVPMAIHAEELSADEFSKKYQSARWDPIHFKPAIEKATDEQCLACHQEILEKKPLETSPSGVKTSDSLAWYQTLDVYSGEQDSFHRRHLVTPMAKELMNLKCNSCHQGYNPQREVTIDGDTTHVNPLMRKLVDTEICLMCHGEFNFKVMGGLTGPWTTTRDRFQNNCLTCHRAFRTNRHKVNFLNADAIENAGLKDGDSCYGCHGGRAWYATPYPYVRRNWPRMSKIIPEWAKNRPTEYEQRFNSTSKTKSPQQ